MTPEASYLFRCPRFSTDLVLELREESALGTPARALARVLVSEAIALEDLVGLGVAIQSVGFPGEQRNFFGIIESAELAARTASPGAEAALHEYSFTVVSRLELLAQSVHSRIFQDLTVPEIISEVLDAQGVDSSRREFSLSESYPKLEYVTQYEESDLHFISRLAESEGIYFYSRPDLDEEIEKLIFADTSAQATPELRLPLRHPSQMDADTTCVYSLDEIRAVAPGKVTLNAYDFKRPSLSQLGSAQADVDTELELYDFSDDFSEPSDGKRRARLRLEALQSERVRFRIQSNEPGLAIGQKLTIEGDEDREYFVAMVHVEYHRSGDPSSAPNDSSPSEFRRLLQITAELTPIELPFRLPERHARPVIWGPQTATVVAPDGSPMEEIYCDEHGRAKVRFHWDQGSEFFDRASCWMRVTQLATSGSMVLPRVHWEVLVEFLEGNPDKPHITGRLYNGTFMPPYELPGGRTRTSIQTSSTPGGGGTNEIRFEDKAGAEEIMIHSQYNMVTNAANNRNKKVTGNETVVIGNNATSEIGADSETKITNACRCTVGSNADVVVGANRTVEVNAVYGLTAGGNASTTVGANQMEMIGNPLDGVIALAAAEAAELAQGAAAHALGKAQGTIAGAVGAALGPIQGLANQAGGMTASVDALGRGSLAATAGLVAGAAGLPSASGVAEALLPASVRDAPGAAASAAGVGVTNLLHAAVNSAAGKGMARAKEALSGGGGQDASGAGGQSTKNRGGPAGDLAGFTEEDLSAGPGYGQWTVTGNHTETTSALAVTAAAGSVLTNVSGNMTQTVGAAHMEVILGDRAESIEGMKSETSLGLIVITKSDESETVHAIRSAMIGGARVEMVDGNREISSDVMISIAGAMHKIEAQTKLTLKCGASSIVVDGSGVTIQSPIVDFTGASITLTKDGHEG